MPKTDIYTDTFYAMGTSCDVVLPGIEPDFGELIFKIIKSEVIQLENKLSRFIFNSYLSELNRTTKNEWVSVTDDIWDILTICYDFYQMSNGAFDITVASLIALWKNSENPSDDEIEKAKMESGFDKVELDFENKKLRFLVDGIEFDMGAVGKGIALDALKPILEKQGVKSGIVSFGESSILAIGAHPNGDYWPLGIRNQVTVDEYVHVFETSNETITTSGTIVTTDDGELVKRKHIISPATGLPVSMDKTISVKSDSAIMGEFISTTWLILQENDKGILSEKLKNLEILEVSYVEDNEIQTKLSILNDSQ